MRVAVDGLKQIFTKCLMRPNFSRTREKTTSLLCSLWHKLCFFSPLSPRTVLSLTAAISMKDILGKDPRQLWSCRSVSCRSMACVIAQRRVLPIAVSGNPLTEHNQLFVQAYVRADQQVLSLTGWKSRLQPRRFEGEAPALRTRVSRMR